MNWKLRSKLKQIAVILLVMVTVVTYMPGMSMIAYGEDGDVIEISSEQDLKDFATRVNSGDVAVNAILKADIEVSSDWVPIGNEVTFNGTFDGDMHKITFRNTTAGLIGTLGGSVENVIVEGSIIGDKWTGAIAGKSSGNILRCLNTATVTNNDDYLGGIVGEATGGSIQFCGNTANISTTSRYVAGIVGKTKANVVSCYNTGSITTTRNRSGANIGGIIGHLDSTKIGNCYNTGQIIVDVEKSSNFGSILGWGYIPEG